MEQSKEKRGFLSRLLGSRVNTTGVSWKEKYLGHLIGPLGLILVVNTVAALVEKFFTQQAGLMFQGDSEALANIGSIYEVLATVTKLLAIVSSIAFGFIIQKIPSKYGRFRPVYFFVGFLTLIICCLIFLFPGASFGASYWRYFFSMFVTYNVICTQYFYLFRDNIVSLSTHNKIEKTQLTFFRKLCWTLISGILIGLLVNSVVLPFWLDKDISGYPLLMIILTIVSIPLFLMEYYYTNERVIKQETEEEEKDVNKVPLKEQFKALLKDKYFIILFILTTVITISDNFKGGNVQYYYIKYLLDGVDNGAMFSIYQIVTGVPLGIGAFLIYPLSKKFGVKNVTFFGYLLFFIGSGMGLLDPSNLPLALVAGFIRQIGQLPNAYVFATLICFAYDHIEFKNGFRVEGLLGMLILFGFQTACAAPFAGGYESSLLQMGFTDVEGYLPPENIENFMGFCFYGVDFIVSIAFLVLLPFVTVEKNVDFMNLELLRREKQKTIDEGKVWIEPAERERLEDLEAKRTLEENRIKDLKARCERKGLNFEEENAKYLEKVRLKEEKKQAKLKKKEEAKLRKKNKQN